MWTISKTFSFSSGHFLEGLPSDHPCSEQHGHNYEVTITLRSENLNRVGFVQDYRELSAVKEWIDRDLDHKNLNNVLDFNPTAELIAQFIYVKVKTSFCPLLRSVTVKETDKTSATYEP